MTTVNGWRYQGVDELLVRIEKVHARRWTLRATMSLAVLATVVAGTLLAASLCGYLPDQPPAALRWGLFCGLLAAWGAAAGWALLGVAKVWRQNPAQTARFIEASMPQVRNDLINTVLLSRDDEQVSPQLVQCAIRESLFHADRVDLADSCRPSRRRLRRWATAAAATAAALLVFALLQGGPFRRGITAVLQPSRYVPADNQVELVSLAPGDARVFAGEPMTISLEVRAERAGDMEAEVVIEGEKYPRTMFAERQTLGGETMKFHLRMEAVHQDFRYFIRVRSRRGRGRWPVDRPYFNVGLRNLKIEDFRVRYHYPPYTGIKARTCQLGAAEASLEAPMGSAAELRVGFSGAIPGGVIQFRDGKRTEMARIKDGGVFEVRFPIQADGGYRLIFRDEAGRILKQLPNGRDTQTDGPALKDGFYRIRALPDKPPVVSFLAPNRTLTVPAGAEVQLKIKARDGFALTKLQLWAGLKGSEPQIVRAFQPSNIEGKKQVVVPFKWKLAGYDEDDVIVYFATAADNRNLRSLGGPQTTSSAKFRITIRDAAKVRRDQVRQFDRLQKKLLAILQRQTALRVATEIVRLREKSIIRLRARGAEIHAGQQAVRAALDGLVKDFPFEPETEDIRKAAALLVANEAAIAIDQAQVVMTLRQLDRRGKVAEPLGQTQDGIINVLQEMLSILPALARKLGEIESADSADLTADQRREKRQKFAEDLKKFIAEQKKIIEASRRLNKKDLDDFTPEDEKLIRDLLALQDKWEKFLNESFADFSKLAQQDFSTPSMLKELLAIKTDVTMAKDALKKKAIEIATACEQNGVENAETLTANIEKWLPDEPDREKWNMEAPEGQENFEQAELFTELEDLVGDLLEEEEDLFEEMDDLSSKAMMSGDKGIGWDAKDGPISNMNAQGVTGNQLPNTSEMSGRSGEGRTGKSSGEFVEDKAVGKGGRRTPTRMGDEPFQKGEVNDTSTDPPGGATGGGKLSGSGAEGLEGPTPAEQARQLKRMAGKQASIINRAERIGAKFQAGDYTSFRMKQAIVLMNRVRSDLESGHYRNALRHRRATIQAIRQTQMMVGKKLEVTEDVTKAMPKYVRDDITDARAGKLPAEYREMLEQYYQRLSEGAGQ